MTDNLQISRIATLIGDPSRTMMLMRLMDGRAYTAGELAQAANVTPQTASSHLNKLEVGGLVVSLKQGRHKYYNLFSTDVALAIESLLRLTELSPGNVRRTSCPKGLQEARTCYDHIAGRFGVALADGFMEQGLVVMESEQVRLTEKGEDYIDKLGIELVKLKTSGKPLLKSCLDWSERRPHFAGILAKQLLEKYQQLGWVKKVKQGRQLTLSTAGKRHFKSELAIEFNDLS